MNREALAIANRAVEEGWDAYRIMAEVIAFQKEEDAKFAEENKLPEFATKLRQR